tara:strand:+ start:329 stop:802 length:474 start_codon:yes stop_codon:yes gene_type:complete
MTAANGKSLTPGSTEGLIPHKDHFHTANGQKVAGGGFTTENPGERLFKHKDHFHTEQTADRDTIKVGGPGTLNDETGELEYGHKDHAHGAEGNKIAGSTNPDVHDDHDDEAGANAPTEEDVMRASLAAQRKALRKGKLRGRLSTIMHSKFNKTNQLG